MKTPSSELMKRGEFLRNLGLSTTALMSFYCMGTLTSCSNSDDPEPNNTGNNPITGTAGLTGNAEASKGKVDFTLDLTSNNYAKLKTEGQYVKVGDVLIANTKGSKFVALSRTCTHQGGGLDYRLASNDIKCDNHGGEFNIDGSVKTPPPSVALTTYKTELSTDGNKLRIVV